MRREDTARTRVQVVKSLVSDTNPQTLSLADTLQSLTVCLSSAEVGFSLKVGRAVLGAVVR